MTSAQSDYLDQIQRGVDFVERHLDSEIELARVARHAGLSLWHFQRIFRAVTHETLKGYIRARRLAASLEKLRDPERRIIEIALESGYDSQEAFTRAFKQAFELTPHEYRKSGDHRPFVKKAQIDADYLRHLDLGVSRSPEILELGPLRLVGLATRFYGTDSEKNDLAQKLPPLWSAFVSRLGEISSRVAGTCYGVIRQTEADAELLDYLAAIEVSAVDELPDGMTALELPRARYARFEHVGPATELDHTVNYAYSAWLLGSELRHTGAADLEIYGPRYDPSSESSLIHYALPVTIQPRRA